jgi:two-component system phosphate regulon response regulator PhoB
MTTIETPPILVAEDDATMAKVLRELLRPLGRSIHRAQDGDAVIPMARSLKPSLLILDLNMPKRNGLEVLRAVRRDPALRDLRVLVLTGQGQPETADRVRAAGGDEFMTKPIDLDAVRERVRGMIQAAAVA